jgi:hypothetical protein
MTETADKPRIPYGEILWFEAFEKLIALGVGAKLSANGQDYKIEHWNPEHSHAWIQLRYKEGGQVKKRMVRRGDVLMIELQPGAAAGPCKGGLRDESPRAAPDPISRD